MDPSPTPAVGLRAPAVAVLAATSVLGTVFMVWTCLEHWAWRVPSPFEREAVDAAILALGWVSVATGFAVGLWLWTRVPRNATGRWLWLAAAAMACWHIGIFTPVAALNPLVVGELVDLPLLAMAFLGFPSGRPSPRATRWIVIVAAGRLVTGVVSGLFLKASYPWDWPQVMSPWQVGWVGLPVGALSAWVFGVLPAVAASVVLVRRQRRLPAGARSLTRTVTTSGVALAVVEITYLVTFNLGSQLIFDVIGRPAAVFRVVLAAQRAEVLVAAVGLAWAFQRRRRVVATGASTLEIDLGSSQPVAAPTVAVRRMLDEPTARMLFARPGGGWSDELGRTVELDGPGRSSTVVVDERGAAVAAVDLDATVPVSAALVEIAAATVAARLHVERSAALARATERELVAVGHAVLDASDAARRRLERDLHDGAQQRLVGLALAARLGARHPDPATVSELVDGIGRATDELLGFLTDGPPAVLASGLSSALATLALSCPVPVDLHVDGDLDGDDPSARVLWFVATDAIANAVKHAVAERIEVHLVVRGGSATVSVRDDGRGGMADPPASIATRAAEAGAVLGFESPPGVGTTVAVTVPAVVGSEAVRQVVG